MRKAQNTGSSSIFGRRSRNEKKEHEAKTENTFKAADHLNKPESQIKATKPNKEEENPKIIWECHEGMGVITKPICDPDKDWERPEEVIPNNNKKGS